MRMLMWFLCSLFSTYRLHSRVFCLILCAVCFMYFGITIGNLDTAMCFSVVGYGIKKN